jgi:DNA-binding FadR family transcriptional regulator
MVLTRRGRVCYREAQSVCARHEIVTAMRGIPTDVCSPNHSSGHDDGVEVPRSAQSLSAWWRNIAQPGSARWKAERWSVNMLRRLRTRSACCGRPGEPGC